uniref:Elongation of very long chain fatty acids protein n=1 Tax=Dermatophagoides pteronyssinus TaxID=6956 RepID=A0A6P6XZY3_DERPT|nr:elongation of very long chain fatty acids protein 6-like [Dermatophagoides pteronyssinus]
MDDENDSQMTTNATFLKLSTYVEKNFHNVSFDFSLYPGFNSALNIERLLLLNLSKLKYFIENYEWLPFAFSLLYFIIIVCWIPRLMRTRQPYRLNDVISFWNLTMALFSIVGTFRLLPELIFMIQNYSLFQSICDDRYIDDPRFFLWMFLFQFSKIFELLTSLFIVLNKQKLLSIHWIYYIISLCYSWQMLNMPSNTRWLVCTDFLVHSFMHLYFAMKLSTPHPLPRLFPILITLLQIIQGIICLITEWVTLWYPQQVCHKQKYLSIIGFTIYAVFTVWLIRIFIEKYLPTNDHEANEIKKNE